MSRASWFFVGAGVLVLLLSLLTPVRALNSALMLLLLGAAAVTVSFLLRGHAQKRLPNIPEEEFLRRLRPHTKAPDELLLQKRKHVARILGLPQEKLDPRQSLTDLSNRLDFLGSCLVALGDLRYEVEELYEDSSLQPPTQAETVGDLITQLAHVKHKE